MAVKRLGFLVVVLVMACGKEAPPTGKAVSSPSASQFASTSRLMSPSPSTPEAMCRLPVLTPDGQGAFINFPAATVSFDPKATGLQGNGSAYYDRAFSRWLPVNRSSVSSDGSRYGYLEPKVPGTAGRARLHVVNVSNGNDKLYELGSLDNSSAYVIVDFAPEGVWLSYAGYEAPGRGLLLLDLATGLLKDSGIPEITEPVAGAPGAFWFTDGGPNPQTAAIGFTIPARMQRLTISDGKTQVWFSKPGSYLRSLGTDLAGHPIFGIWSSQSDGYDVWLALSPSDAKVIGLPQSNYQLIADGHGVWFGSQQGIYLYSEASGLQKVSNQPGYPANGCF
jgi:hypothetical protein